MFGKPFEKKNASEARKSAVELSPWRRAVLRARARARFLSLADVYAAEKSVCDCIWGKLGLHIFAKGESLGGTKRWTDVPGNLKKRGRRI